MSNSEYSNFPIPSRPQYRYVRRMEGKQVQFRKAGMMSKSRTDHPSNFHSKLCVSFNNSGFCPFNSIFNTDLTASPHLSESAPPRSPHGDTLLLAGSASRIKEKKKKAKRKSFWRDPDSRMAFMHNGSLSTPKMNPHGS